MDDLARAAAGFFTLLLIPLLGILALLRRRALPVLAWAVGAWTLSGVVLLPGTARALGLARAELERIWLAGMGLGIAFLFVAWLRTRRKVARWIKVTMVAVTLLAFARGLVVFLRLVA